MYNITKRIHADDDDGVKIFKENYIQQIVVWVGSVLFCSVVYLHPCFIFIKLHRVQQELV